MHDVVVVVGSSVAGVRTAQALRSQGHEGRIVLLGAEPDHPYDKPPLSKHFLAGTWDSDRIALLDPDAAEKAGIELRLGNAAEHLDVAGRAIVLADGSRVAYDTLVIATGAAARPSPWLTESGVHVIRTLDDSRALHEELTGDAPVVVIGGGFIGAEVAATASSRGHSVTVVDPLPAPIARVVGAEIGALLTQVHERHGVDTRFGVGVVDVDGRAGDLRVTLSDGEVLQAATVVVGIGATPNVQWLQSSGIAVDDGVLCDQYCRATDQTGIYAVGDVARWLHPVRGEHVRSEHWTNAAEQAVCVAHNIVHPDDLRPYGPIEYVWSDQYDWKIQIVGRPDECASHEMLGDVDAQPPHFAALYRDQDGNLGASVTVNWAKALVTCRRLIGTQTSFDDARSSVAALATPVVAS